jgi:hypothetical protein
MYAWCASAFLPIRAKSQRFHGTLLAKNLGETRLSALAAPGGELVVPHAGGGTFGRDRLQLGQKPERADDAALGTSCVHALTLREPSGGAHPEWYRDQGGPVRR